MGSPDYEVVVAAASNSEKRRHKSHTENGQIKKDLKLESMLPSMDPRLLQESLDQRVDQ